MAVAAALAATAGCSGASSSPPAAAAGRGGTLTVGTAFSSASLDPSMGDAGPGTVYLDPLYAPLIRFATDGSLRGVLATSWGYTGPDDRTFRLTLRPGVTFSDGSPVTGAAVAASIRHFKAGGHGAWLGDCPGVTAPASTTVQITCTRPDPDIAEVLTDRLLGGDIAAPSSTATRPVGAGPYILDASATVTGSTYTYLPNPRYFDQKTIHWDKIVVKYLSNASSALDALRSGQVQELWTVDPQTLTAATADGMQLSSAPVGFEGVNLADRGTAGGNPLGSLKVRQALEYAVDRPAIVKALFGSTPGASATEEAAIPTEPSAWNPAVNTYYPYDPAKARQLLAQAGYPSGFQLKVEDQGSNALLVQAVTGYWSKIGVQAAITTDTTDPGWISSVLSKKYPAMGFAYGGLPMYLQAIDFFGATPNVYNPFGTNDPAVTGLISTAIAAPAAQQDAAWQQVQAYGIKQAWYLAVALIPVGLLHNSSIVAPGINGGYFGNDTDVTPA